MEDVKLFVTYKNKNQVLKSDIITPIQTGRAIAPEVFEGMLGDDTGDNISHLNSKYCELSAIYWVWKNYDKIGNPEKIGFMHYRRHFLFGDKKYKTNKYGLSEFDELNEEYLKNNLCDDETIKQVVKNYDLILPAQISMRSKNIYNYFKSCHDITYYDYALDVISKKFPEYRKIAKEYNKQKKGYFLCMFILKKEYFFNLCNWLFPILEELDKKANSSTTPAPDRIIGYVAERLIGMYLYKLKKEIPSKTLPASFVRNTSGRAKLKLFTTYKTKNKILKSNIITPIQTGRAIADEIFEGMLGDDTGENISKYNQKYCELTAQYWVWKNYDKIGNPEKIGFMHYRRHFLFNDGKYKKGIHGLVEFGNINKKYLRKNLGTDAQIQNIVKDYNVILPEKDNIMLSNNVNSNYEQYKKHHIIAHYDLAMEILKQKYPEFSEIATEYNRSNQAYFLNMFILKKEIFFDLCEWLFSILFEVEKKIDYTNLNSYDSRALGFISERLCGIYFYKLEKENKYKILHRPVSLILSTTNNKPQIIQKIIKTLLALKIN